MRLFKFFKNIPFLLQLYCEIYRVAVADRGALNETKAVAAAILNMAASDGQASSHGDEKSPKVPTQTLLPGNVCGMFIKSTSRKVRRKYFFICCIKKMLI
jgi:hypothetical protein